MRESKVLKVRNGACVCMCVCVRLCERETEREKGREVGQYVTVCVGAVEGSEVLNI